MKKILTYLFPIVSNYSVYYFFDSFFGVTLACFGYRCHPKYENYYPFPTQMLLYDFADRGHYEPYYPGIIANITFNILIFAVYIYIIKKSKYSTKSIVIANIILLTLPFLMLQLTKYIFGNLLQPTGFFN